MGQKVNPIGFRLGVNKTWSSKWFVDPREYAETLHEDLKLRKLLLALPEAKNADISEVEIVRHPQRITLVIHSSRPGVIIGAKGSTIERIGTYLQKQAGKKIQIKIKEVKRPETDAQIIALNVARQLKGRSAFRRTLKMTVAAAKKAGVLGIKIRLSGRLGGAEMSRTESHKAGRIPLHTLRADIDYGTAVSDTAQGSIGVKVWVFKGEVYKRNTKEDAGSLVKKKREPAGTRS